MKTFYWYDYETFGLSPKVQRIAQFAGIRTDENLNILEEHMFYCKPTHDSLPAPEACAVTGITPQLCEKKGLIEHDFIKKIHQEFSKPETCIVGYNSIAFDDEFTRHTLFRNFIDPYSWHWQNGNARWDILNVARFCYAHKEEGSLKWVKNDKNRPIFKLDTLAPANNIEHTNAHDAMADVRATIGIAAIIKKSQPKFFDYALSLNDKKEVSRQVRLLHPMLLTSPPFGYKSSFTRLVTAICYHPDYSDRAIVFNLNQGAPTIFDGYVGVNNMVYVAEVTVHAQWGGQGIGSTLLEHIATAAKEQGVDGLIIDRHEQNLASAGMMRKAGFVEVDCFLDLKRRHTGSRKTTILKRSLTT